MVKLDQYLDALKALEFLLDIVNESHWCNEIRKDIEAWTFRNEYQRHQNHYGTMGSFNDLGYGLPEKEEHFSAIKSTCFSRYFLDIQTIAYSLSKNEGRSIPPLEMKKIFGNFGCHLTVQKCNKCEFYGVRISDIQLYAASHYGRIEVMKNYENGTLSRMVNDRLSEKFNDYSNKVNFLKKLITEERIFIGESAGTRVTCSNCGSVKLDLTTWILNEAETKLIQIRDEDFTLPQNIRDVFR